jgi:hypothetical protein
VENHPIKGKVVSHGERPRERYVEDGELIEALKVANKVVRAYVGLKVLTGLRRTDILCLRIVDLKAAQDSQDHGQTARHCLDRRPPSSYRRR